MMITMVVFTISIQPISASENNLNEFTQKFNELLKCIETFDQWNDVYTNRLKEVLLDVSASPFKAEELNALSKNRACECPIYLGLKKWTECIEYPTQDLICNLGGSLVLLIENQI